MVASATLRAAVLDRVVWWVWVSSIGTLLVLSALASAVSLFDRHSVDNPNLVILAAVPFGSAVCLYGAGWLARHVFADRKTARH